LIPYRKFFPRLHKKYFGGFPLRYKKVSLSMKERIGKENFLCLFGVGFSFQEMLKRHEIL